MRIPSRTPQQCQAQRTALATSFKGAHFCGIGPRLNLSRAKLAPTRNAPPNNPRTHSTITSHFITAPYLSSNQVISRARDRGSLSHDLSHDPSRDLPVPKVSRDSTARDPGTITHDQPKYWSSSTSQDYTRFGPATRPLINTWKTVGRIHKHVRVDQSTKTRLIGVTPQ